MRVLIVNTSERTGGAAVAAHRLMDALNNNGVKAKMLVRDKETDQLTVSALPQSWRQQWNFLWERFVVWTRLHFKREHLFEIDIANCGTDITKLPILESGKPVVWTMHDIWPATAICHYCRGCEQYQVECTKCPLLPGGSMAKRVWRQKVRMLQSQCITFVCCSEWLAGEAKKSALLAGQRIVSIPNAIDSRVFCPQDKQQARQILGLPVDRRIILFVSQRVTDPRKGMNYFVEAIQTLVQQHPEMRENTGVAILGGHAEEVASQLALPSYPLGYVSDPQRIVSVYNAADVFVLPSLEPNTLMEAMACGVPCVSFRVGGIPEMIDHQSNGYVAQPCDANDLAQGIHYVLAEADYDELSHECVKKVARCYSQQSVANRYIEEYQLRMKPKSLNG